MSDNPVAFVAGASRGMGRATSIDLARHGYDVVVAARSFGGKEAGTPGTVEHTAQEVKRYGRQALPLRLDMNDLDDIAGAVAQVVEHFGRIDLLVIMANWVDHSPGGSYSTVFGEMRWDSIAGHVGLTVLGHLRLIREVVPVMVAQESGTIVNITQNQLGTRRPPRSPAVTDPPLMTRLTESYRASAGAKAGSPMVPIARGATERIAPALRLELEHAGVVILTLDPGMTLSNPGMEEFYKNLRGGFTVDGSHSVLVPARAITYLATCRNPGIFNGKFVIAEDLVRTFGLMSEEEIYPPMDDGPPPVESLPPMAGWEFRSSPARS